MLLGRAYCTAWPKIMAPNDCEAFILVKSKFLAYLVRASVTEAREVSDALDLWHLLQRV